MSGDIFGCHMEEVLLESSGWRPKILLNILQCTGQPPTTKNYVAPNVNWPRSNKTLFTKWAVGWIWPTGCNVPTPGLARREQKIKMER